MSGKHSREAVRCLDDMAGRSARAGRRFAGLALAVVLAAVLGSPATGPAGEPALRPTEAISFRGAASGLTRMPVAAPDATGLEGIVTTATVTVPAATAQERKEDPRLEDWREEGIRMASELTGIPEAFFRWLQDKGVPVGEFMRFLMPFLEWLDMVEPHNGTQSSPRPQRPSGDQPRQTAI